MAKVQEREEALRLRKQGSSIGDIAKGLDVSKGTVSSWCRDISLSSAAIQKIALKSKAKSTAALLAYSEKQRTKRQSDIAQSLQSGREKLGKLSARDVFCIGLGLYWGEGYKKGSQEFGFSNSDPQMVLFYIVWLKEVFGVEKDRLILRVSINETHTDRIKEVERYWSQLTGIPRSQFTKSSLIRTTARKVYQNHKDHYGTLRIKVRGGTTLRRMILGALSQAGAYADSR